MHADSLPPVGGDETTLRKGASLGRYVVLGLLGRGGMGEVYAAYDPELDREIAVKLLRARGGGQTAEDGRTRLLREAQAIARLSHPNVVIVHDVGTFKESVFVAMESRDLLRRAGRRHRSRGAGLGQRSRDPHRAGTVRCGASVHRQGAPDLSAGGGRRLLCRGVSSL